MVSKKEEIAELEARLAALQKKSILTTDVKGTGIIPEVIAKAKESIKKAVKDEKIEVERTESKELPKEDSLEKQKVAKKIDYNENYPPALLNGKM